MMTLFDQIAPDDLPEESPRADSSRLSQVEDDRPRKRTDVHRPSAIDPEQYHFVALGYQKQEGIEDVYELAFNRELLRAHMQATGARFSQHAHGGNCHICGAHCVYEAIFHHIPTNKLIKTGMDCAEKMHMGDPERFRAFKKAIHDARELKAGKNKAEAILRDAGLERAWQIYIDEKAAIAQRNGGRCSDEIYTVYEMVDKLVRYGSISDRQLDYARTLIDLHDNRDRIEAERQAERESAKPAPSGRLTVKAQILKISPSETQWGVNWRMTIKAAEGWIANGTAPGSVLDHIDFKVNGGPYGDQACWNRDRAQIELTATFTPSDRDPKFAFFKRPTFKA